MELTISTTTFWIIAAVVMVFCIAMGYVLSRFVVQNTMWSKHAIYMGVGLVVGGLITFFIYRQVKKA